MADPPDRPCTYQSARCACADIGLDSDTCGVETVHDCPTGGLTRCCERPPFELPHPDRITTDLLLVTCTGPRRKAKR